MLPSATFSTPQSSSVSLLPPPDVVVASSPKLQQFSTVRKMTRDLQQQRLRRHKGPQIPPDEAGTPTKRSVHPAVYQRNLNNQYNEALKHYEQYTDQLLSEQAIDLTRIMNNVDGIVKKLTNPLQSNRIFNSYLQTTPRFITTPYPHSPQ